jgi:cytochrome c1
LPSATGLVGPPLGGLTGRTYLGGAVTNTPENLARWIRNPRELAPRTAMPDVALSEADAKLIASYLGSR